MYHHKGEVKNCIKNGTNMTIQNSVLKENLRRLFADHAVYTKFYIESALFDLPDATIISNRLLQNQDDIGNYLKTYIGNSNGDQLAKLLKEHIMAAGAVVNALKTKDNYKIDSLVKQLFVNSKEVAKFLGSFNPDRLPFSTTLREFNKHNQQIISMAIAQYDGNYVDTYKAYDTYFSHMMFISDSITYALDNESAFIGSNNDNLYYTAWGDSLI